MRILTNDHGTWAIIPLSDRLLDQIIDLIQASDTPYGVYIQDCLKASWTKERVKEHLDRYQGTISLRNHNLSLLAGIYGWPFDCWDHIEAYIHNLDEYGARCKAKPHMWKRLIGEIEIYQARVWEIRSTGVPADEAHRQVRQLMPGL